MWGRAAWGARTAVTAAIAVAVMAWAVPIASGRPLALRPIISSVSPSSGPVGTPVTINGLNFTGATSVKFDGVAATYTVTSSRTITTAVPPLATTGLVTVESASSRQPFNVTFGLSADPTSGPPTSVVTLAGSDFTPHSFVGVYFDAAAFAHVRADANGDFANVSFTVPASARPGPHTFTAFSDRVRKAKQTFVVSTAWPQRGYSNAHTGTNPYENVLSPTSVSGLTVDWSSANQRANALFRSSPAVVAGSVYIGCTDGKLEAVNAATGNRLWTLQVGAAIDSSPAVVNGIVYFGSSTGQVIAANAATGATVWSYGTSGQVSSSPAVANGIVYIGSGDGKVYALNAATGTLVWSRAFSQSFSSPAVVNGIVYIGTDDEHVYALNAASGATVWSYQTGGEIRSSPAVANGIVYIGSGDGKVYALNAATGALVWSYSTLGSVGSSPAVSNGLVFVGSDDGKVYALDAAHGGLDWSRTTGAAVESSPAVANEVVYVGSDAGSLYALNEVTGAVLWSSGAIASIDSSPAVTNGTVYVGVGNALDAFALPTEATRGR